MNNRLCLATTVALGVLTADGWAGLLKLLSYTGPVHCGTPFVNVFLLMSFYTAVSVPVLLENWKAYRLNGTKSVPCFRFLARLPVIILVALLLAYWGMLALTKLF